MPQRKFNTLSRALYRHGTKTNTESLKNIGYSRRQLHWSVRQEKKLFHRLLNNDIDQSAAMQTILRYYGEITN